MKEMFDEYVRTRTRENWKFWIVSFSRELLLVCFNFIERAHGTLRFIFLDKVISSVYYSSL